MAKEETTIIPLFASPLMKVPLDLDLKKLTEFVFEMQNKDKKGVRHTNRGGWQSNDIKQKKHEEFEKLKKEISQHLQIYHSEIFGGMKFKKNITPYLTNMWVNINCLLEYNEWHIHPMSVLSGVYYIKHDGSKEHGDIIFKHPKNLYMSSIHWPKGIVERGNEITAEFVNIIPTSNLLLIFPSWLEHKVETNCKDDTRISLSFNTTLEKKS
jgi:uncharacterized protein (TIGR02466 family)